jgi:peptidoglycan hydrolase-like protein with peptidoglycan-binding domain
LQLLTILAAAWFAAASPQSSTTTHQPAAKHRAKAAPQTKSAVSPKASSTAKKRPAVAAHRAPQQPSTERLKEIQQALADKGYFSSEANGTWGPSSIDALKRFQHDQNLTEDGKIGSLSLIALGLGPKREAAETEQKTP